MQPAWAALPHDSQVSLGARELSSTAIHCCQALPVDQAIKWPLQPKKNHLWIPVPLKKKKLPQPILQATPTVVPLPPYLGPRAGHTTHEIHLSVHCTTIGPVFMVQNTAFWWQDISIRPWCLYMSTHFVLENLSRNTMLLAHISQNITIFVSLHTWGDFKPLEICRALQIQKENEI